MKTDTEIRNQGFKLLFENMNMVEAERFISLIQREKFDYTKWRKNLFKHMSVEELSDKAMNFVKNQENKK